MCALIRRYTSVHALKAMSNMVCPRLSPEKPARETAA